MRYIIGKIDKADIGIASATYDIVGFPPVEMRQMPAPTQAG